MKAVAVTEFGGVPQLLELPKPTPAPGEVLVRLVGASLNPFDRAVYDGFLQHLPHSFPLVIGFDGAGVVEKIGDGVERFAEGEMIYGSFAHLPLGRGTLAEYIAIPSDSLIEAAPRRISPTEAAAAPGAGMTAVGLIEEAGVVAGQTVLIVGASGGVGTLAVQLASAKGARVLATARPDAAGQVRSLGAAATIDYGRGCSVAEAVLEIEPDGVDVLLDLVTDHESFHDNLKTVRDRGQAISLRYAAQDEVLSGRIGVTNFSLRDHPRAGEFLAALTNAIDEGKLQVVIQSELSLDEAPAVLAARKLRGARGKTVVKI